MAPHDDSIANVHFKAGPDALVYTMFFSYGFEVFMFCSFFGLAILLPINVTSFNQIPCDSNETLPGNETVLCDVEGLETISLSNIPEVRPDLLALRCGSLVDNVRGMLITAPRRGRLDCGHTSCACISLHSSHCTN